LPHVKIATHGSENDATFDGVVLKTLPDKGSVEFGHTMRGTRIASFLLVEAADGFSAAIVLPEIDSDLTTNKLFSLSCGTENRWMQKRGRTGSSFRMKREWLIGCDKS
jgi:hypothetical protein